MSGAVLLVDDDQVSRMILRHLVSGFGHRTVEAYDVESARERLAAGQVSAVISDYQLPDGTGLDLVDLLAHGAPDTPLMLVTGLSQRGGIEDPRMAGVRHFLTKPVAGHELKAVLDELARSIL